MLTLLLTRLQRAHKIGDVVVATSTDGDDDPIEKLAGELAVRVYRGPRDDVLTRFAGAAVGHEGPLVRVTADCPLIDPTIVDDVLALFRTTPGCDYASNIEPRTWPDGLDVEVLSPEALQAASELAVTPEDREHVTTVVRRNADRFKSTSLVCNENLGDIRWTVDTLDDLEFIRQLVSRMGRHRYTAGIREILEAVRAEPSLADLHGRRG